MIESLRELVVPIQELQLLSPRSEVRGLAARAVGDIDQARVTALDYLDDHHDVSDENRAWSDVESRLDVEEAVENCDLAIEELAALLRWDRSARPSVLERTRRRWRSRDRRRVRAPIA